MKFATIGTSFITHQIIEAFLSNPRMILEAVFSRNLETAQALAHRYGCIKTYTKLDQLWQDDEVECIYIASPNALHYEQIKQALFAKKHIICEKPIVLTKQQFQDVCALAQRQQCFLFEAITTLHMPNYKVLQEKINQIGPIHVVSCDLSQYSSRYDLLKQGTITNVFDQNMAGGACYDLGVYCLHVILGLFGRPKSVMRSNLEYTNGIDTSGVILLKYPHMHAILSYGKDTYGNPGVIFQSEQGYLKVPGPCSRLMTLEWHHDNVVEDIGEITEAQHHRYEIRNFINIMKHNDHREEHRLWKHSLLVYEVMDALRDGKGIL